MIHIQIWQFIIIILAVILIAAVATFFITRKLIQKQLQKNPPISENTIRIMMAQMGRTPSEKQVRAVMKSIEEENGTAAKKDSKKNK